MGRDNYSNKIWSSMAGMEAVADLTWVVNNSNKMWYSMAGVEAVAAPTWVESTIAT